MAGKGNIVQRIVRLVFDRNAARKAGADSKKAVGVVDKALGNLKKSAISAGAAVAAAFSFYKIIQGIKNVTRAFIESEAIWNRLEGTLATLGIRFEDVEGQVKAVARAMQDTTAVGDEEFVDVLQTLIAISGDYESSLQNVSVVADLAAGLQIDLATAAQLVGRAMAGQTQTLTRYGIIVEKGSDAVETIRKNFKGLAENESRSLAGQLKRLSNEWGDLKEALGETFVEMVNGRSVLEDLIDLVQTWAEWITNNKDKIVQGWTDVFDAIKLGWRQFYNSWLIDVETWTKVQLLFAKAQLAITRGYELRTERMQKVVELEQALLDIQTRRLELQTAENEEQVRAALLAYRAQQAAGGAAPPKRTRLVGGTDSEETQKAQKAEIANLTKLAELGLLTEDEKQRVLDLERQLSAEIKAGIPDLERRLEIAQQLAGLTAAAHGIRAEGIQLTPAAPPAPATTSPSIPGQFGTVRLSEREEAAIERRKELQAIAAQEMLDNLAQMEMAAQRTAAIMTDAFSTFFETLILDSRNAGGALVAAMLEGLARYLDIRAAEAFAEGLLGNPAGFAAGIAFSAAAGAARALESQLGGRNRGGGSVPIGAGGGNSGSSRALPSKEPDITLVLQGDFDALNPKFVRAVYTAQKEGIQTIGGGNVRIQTMPRGGA